MVRTEHNYVLEFLNKAGQRLGGLPAAVDWEPAAECVRFAAQRGAAVTLAGSVDAASVEPVYHPQIGAPYCGGFRVSVQLDGAPPLSRQFPLAYLRSLAQSGSAGLVKQGLLKEGEHFYYLVAAYAGEAPATATAAFKVAEVATALPLKDGSLAERLKGARPFGRQLPDDFPVFMPQAVLEEAGALALAAGARESGGLLIGHLRREVTLPDIYLEVTALIPAQHTSAELTGITFTPATWAAARDAIKLRRQDELLAGWEHSHPGRWMCAKECAPEQRKQCPLMRNFFSAEDREFHRTVFAKAYGVALVVTVTDDGLQYALFGWRAGSIQQRGFHIFGNPNSRPLELVEAAGIPEANEHATSCR